MIRAGVLRRKALRSLNGVRRSRSVHYAHGSAFAVCLVSGVVEKRERHLCVMVVPLRDVGRLVLHSPCGRACAGSLRNGTVKKGCGRACALPGVSQHPGKRLSAETSHNKQQHCVQAACEPSHARDFADGARLSQSCTRLPRTRFNGRISEWHRKRSLIGASAAGLFSSVRRRADVSVEHSARYTM